MTCAERRALATRRIADLRARLIAPVTLSAVQDAALRGRLAAHERALALLSPRGAHPTAALGSRAAARTG